jgi:hypothetical protein
MLFDLPRPSSCELRKHFSFLFTPFFEDFSAAQPFLLQQVNDQLVHDFLSSRTKDFFFLLSLWIYLWLAETSQQPISQTTWLKVTPIVTNVIMHYTCAPSSRSF